MPKRKHKIRKFSKIHPTLQLFAAVILFVISVIITTTKGVAGWEIELFRMVYELPNFLHPLFFAITQLGSIVMLGALLAVYLATKHYHIVIRLLMTGTLAYLIAGVSKDLWGRARPGDLLDGIASLDYVVRGPGFPSGHVALATALALTIAHYVPRKYHWLIALWIVGVALSRMYLGIHFPMDLLGGFAIGWGSYALFRHVRLYDIMYSKKKATKAK